MPIRQEHKMRVLQKVLKICGPKRKWWEAGDDYIMRSFITCMLYQISSSSSSNKGGLDVHGI
jgi:hypothetical protein